MTATQLVAVSAAIFRNDHVLAMRRAVDRDAGAGLWETVSGRVDLGEEPYAAIAREIWEETRLTVRIDPRPIDAYSAWRGSSPMVVIVYRADYEAGEVQRSSEHDDHAWITVEEFATRSSLPRLVAAVRAASQSRAAFR